MKAIDISPLAKGLLTVIGIALATGQYGKLESWARREAIQALKWKQGLPYFFPKPHALRARQTTPPRQ
jgi:hypothetical protein